jgi:hypothetical protein
MNYSLRVQHEAVVEAHKIFEWYEESMKDWVLNLLNL